MAWDLEVIFNGLCLYHLPDYEPDGGGESPLRGNESEPGPAVLMVKTNQNREGDQPGHGDHRHIHRPLLTFNPEDLDDFSVDMAEFRVKGVALHPDAQGNHLASVSLKDIEVTFEVDDDDRRRNPFRMVTGRSLRQPAPSGFLGSTRRQQERFLGWVASIFTVDNRVTGVKTECFGQLGDDNPAVGRVQLSAGSLESHRVIRTPEGYPQFEFLPITDPSNGLPVIQALADQVCLRFVGLEEAVKVRLSKGSAVSPTDGDQAELVFPRDPDRGLIQISITNLPIEPEVRDTDELVHFEMLYDLLDFVADGRRSIPKLVTGDLGGVAGSNALCPGTTCP